MAELNNKPGHDGVHLIRRRAGPRLLRPAQALKSLGHAKHADIVKAAADDLHADGKTLASKPPLMEIAGFSDIFHGTV
jgi:hypothetical protein